MLIQAPGGGVEDDIDQEEFERVLGEKRANKLYSIFRKKHLNLGTPVTSKCNMSLGGKRKISPTASIPESSRPRTSVHQYNHGTYINGKLDIFS